MDKDNKKTDEENIKEAMNALEEFFSTTKDFKKSQEKVLAETNAELDEENIKTLRKEISDGQ